MRTLVIGARGGIGRHVVEQLLAAGQPVRASVRDRAKADFPAAVEVVEADLTKPETLWAALTGVRRVFLYASPAQDFVDVARDADLEHVVMLSSGSVLLPSARGNAIAEEHRAVERVLADSGLSWTPIRPLVLANNALNWADSIRAEGVVRLFRPEAMTAPVHERDVAAVAVAALLGRPEDGMLTGPELITQRRQVELIAAATGRDIEVVEMTESQARQRFGDSPTVDAVLRFIAEAANGGSPATDTIQRALGFATPFEQWAREHAVDFR
ncbi:NAD(P)H-binding protein [Actinocrispum sp. NPDC049592]|uniref:SDR family oxidoreductase n=1 Tax=Actinocrispum sp. NPDC049592 TaxID=3154835 RepID=UPI0034277AAC